MTETVLRLSDVAKSYGPTKALDGVDLALGRGEIVGLLGPNGAGKSTLFQLCSGLFAPDRGSVELFGTTYRADAPGILSRLGVVFQSRSLDADIPVRANLSFHGRLFGLYGRQLAARIAEVCEMMQIADLAGTQVRKLSGGNQRRVEIARALLNQPDLLLLDEPTTGLDAAARTALLGHVRSIVAERRLSVLWATHLVDEVEAADRIVLLVKGRIAGAGSPSTLMAESGASTLTEAYIAMTGQRPQPARAD